MYLKVHGINDTNKHDKNGEKDTTGLKFFPEERV
jgi:hypothetical protein